MGTSYTRNQNKNNKVACTLCVCYGRELEKQMRLEIEDRAS